MDGWFHATKDLKHLYWEKGGRYHELSKAYENPPDAAYEPHIFFLLESRHLIKRPMGRTDEFQHVNGVCRAKDFMAVVRQFNSKFCPAEHRESMDNAYWPFLHLTLNSTKRTVWWLPGENPGAILEEVERRIAEGVDLDATIFDTGKKALNDPLESKKTEESEEIPQSPSSSPNLKTWTSPNYARTL